MIEISHLGKNYGHFKAVADVSFSLVPGEVLGFLGPNGAGKSTTMKMLTGFLRPTEGSVKIWGHDMWQDTLDGQAHIGYLPEGAPAYEEMSVRGFLSFIAEVRGYAGQEVDERVDAACHAMSLMDVANQKIETLSKGFKRRVGLAQAILHDPDVLILDEPTDGLDPNQKHQVREMIKGLSKDKIVIVSTHILEEVSAVCNRVIVLSEGRIVADTTPEALLARSAYHGAVSMELSDPACSEAVVGRLEQIEGVERVLNNAPEITVFPAANQSDLVERVLAVTREQGAELVSLHVEKGRLDEVFRTLTRGAAQ